MKIINLLIIIFFLIQFKVNAINLDELIKVSILNNKDIKTIKSKIKIKELELSKAYLLDNPMIDIDVMNFPLAQLMYGEEMMNTLQFTIYQKIQLPYKLDIKRKISDLEINKEKYILQEKINELKKDLKINYYSYYFYKEGINTLNENKNIMESLLKILSIKYTTGKILLKDILSLQLEILLIKEKILNFLKERNIIINNINNLIGKENYLSDIEYKNLKISNKDINYEKLLNIYIQNRYILKQLQIQANIEEENYNISKLSYIPDLGLRLSYGIKKNRADILSAGISFEIPLWFNEKEKVTTKEMEEKLNNSKLEIDNLNSNITKELKNIISEIKQLREVYNIYNNLLISNTKEIIKSLIFDYELGKVDFYLVIDNQKKLLDYKLKLLEIISEHEKKISYLEYIIGNDIL